MKQARPRRGDPGAAITNEHAIAASNAKAARDLGEFRARAREPRDRTVRYVVKDPDPAELRRAGGYD